MTKQCVVCGDEATQYDNLHPDDLQALMLNKHRTYPVCDNHGHERPAQKRLYDQI